MRIAAQRVLIAALWALILARVATAQAVYLDEIQLTVPDVARFGGLSAIEVMDDGASALVLSDRGGLFTLALSRGAGRIATVSVCCAAEIAWVDGVQLPELQRDSEGLAVLHDGTIAVSFERGVHARVAVHGRDGAQIRALPAIPQAAGLPQNGAFEGLAVDAQGRLYTVPESERRSEAGSGTTAVLRLADGQWTRFAAIAREGRWSPVALDFDDRGRFYVLERRASLPFGFAARLTRYGVLASGLTAPEVLLDTATGRHGNLEGLSIWRDATGRLVATMVGDNDFMPFRATTLVEYALPD